MDTNPTQVAGLLAFAASTAACVLAAWRSRRPARNAWTLIAAVHLLLLLDVLFGTRHRLHDWFSDGLRAFDAYESRRYLQWLLLAVATTLAIWGLWRLLRRRPYTSAGVLTPVGASALATFALFAVLAIETISWHEIDRVLYLQFGPLMLVALLWIAGAGVTIVAALRSDRSK